MWDESRCSTRDMYTWNDSSLRFLSEYQSMCHLRSILADRKESVKVNQNINGTDSLRMYLEPPPLPPALPPRLLTDCRIRTSRMWPNRRAYYQINVWLANEKKHKYAQRVQKYNSVRVFPPKDKNACCHGRCCYYASEKCRNKTGRFRFDKTLHEWEEAPPTQDSSAPYWLVQ